jgi:hypothetical protein
MRPAGEEGDEFDDERERDREGDGGEGESKAKPESERGGPDAPTGGGEES